MRQESEDDPAACTERRKRVQVRNGSGLHLRMAAEIAKAARALGADITLEYNGARADARSVLSIVTLGAGFGARILVRARGSEADRAVEILERLFSRIIDEGGQAVDHPLATITTTPRLR